nr:transketolase C-terminal domain-containing protein [uncultured Rhodopila sp.]
MNNMSRIAVCDGNEAAAIGVKLSRPDVVAVYPITPQSSLVEYLSKFIAEGSLDAELMNLEGEHSVLSALQGACLAGARTYTATCGPGLAFMFEPYIRTPGLRLPMVASLVNRDMLSPQCVWGGQQDVMTVRDAGWIHLFCESAQEVLDTVIMAYRIAEHPDVMLPVNINHDGNYLSYGVTRVEIPEQPAVDAFLGPKNVNWHTALDPDRPMAVDPLTGGADAEGAAVFAAYRQSQCRGMQSALHVIAEVHAEWADAFGRHYAPLVEEYRVDGADIAIVTIGSMSGAAKDAVDAARERGVAAGVIRIKTFRPFPVEAFVHAAAQVRALGVVDRSVSFGWNCGPVAQEVLGALYRTGRTIPVLSFIGGLAGADLTQEHFDEVIDSTVRALEAGPSPATPETVWLDARGEGAGR